MFANTSYLENKNKENIFLTFSFNFHVIIDSHTNSFIFLAKLYFFLF